MRRARWRHREADDAAVLVSRRSRRILWLAHDEMVSNVKNNEGALPTPLWIRAWLGVTVLVDRRPLTRLLVRCFDRREQSTSPRRGEVTKPADDRFNQKPHTLAPQCDVLLVARGFALVRSTATAQL